MFANRRLLLYRPNIGKFSHLGFATGHQQEDGGLERQPDNYRPGSDSFAYENPWPKLNGSRLDWMFHDGWRRPLAPDQGGKMRRQWLCWGQSNYNEHYDWARFHFFSLFYFCITPFWIPFIFMYFMPDWPRAKQWAYREAHLELLRREQAGLPYISKEFLDPVRISQSLPSDEELRDFEILI